MTLQDTVNQLKTISEYLIDEALDLHYDPSDPRHLESLTLLKEHLVLRASRHVETAIVALEKATQL